MVGGPVSDEGGWIVFVNVHDIMKVVGPTVCFAAQLGCLSWLTKRKSSSLERVLWDKIEREKKKFKV